MENLNNEVKMELLPKGTEYRDIASKAKELGLSYIGVKKEVLFAQVNETITKINAGEMEMPEITEQPAPTTNDENDKASNETKSPAKAAAQKAAGKQKERTVRQATKKWFEEPGAYPYNAGDVVEIIGGKDLIGRKLQVIEPSAKKDMVKGRLIHPVTGGLQNTVIAIAFERIELRESAAKLAADEPTEVNDNQDGVEPTESGNITAEASESVDIPTLEVEESEEKKAE